MKGQVKGKTILCRCEDVTLHEVEASIALGYADIEEVKRYTGFGTGPCQGKECLSVIAEIIAARTGQDPGAIAPFTSRPPLAPTPLKHFAAVADLDPGLEDKAEDKAEHGAGGGHGSPGGHGGRGAEERDEG